MGFNSGFKVLKATYVSAGNLKQKVFGFTFGH